MHSDFTRALDDMAALRQFSGPARDFWPQFLGAAARLAAADIAVLLLGQPGKEPRWSKIGDWDSGAGLSRVRTQFTSQLEKIAERCLAAGQLLELHGTQRQARVHGGDPPETDAAIRRNEV